MKATGVVRRIDQLGRIVLPKEVRDTYGWGEGQPMEMFVDNGRMVLQPYTPNSENGELITQLKILINRTDNLAARAQYEQTVKFLEEGKL